MNYIPKQNPHLSPNSYIPNRTFLSVKRLRPTKGHHRCSSPSSRSPTEEESTCLPLVDRGKQLSSIIFRQRRQEYSGYRQSLAHNSKSAKSGQHSHLLDPPRKYEINFRNIDKLRKRYSLDPPHSLRKNNTNTSIVVSSIKSLQKAHLKTEVQQTEPTGRSGLKQMLRRPSNRPFAESSRTILCNQNNIQLITTRNKNASCFDKQKASIPSIIIAEAQLQKKLTQMKNPFKKKFQNKMCRLKRHKVQSSFRLVVNLKSDEEASVSGWSNQSFYEKVKPRFFEQLSAQRCE